MSHDRSHLHGPHTPVSRMPPARIHHHPSLHLLHLQCVHFPNIKVLTLQIRILHSRLQSRVAELISVLLWPIGSAPTHIRNLCYHGQDCRPMGLLILLNGSICEKTRTQRDM